MQSKGIPGEGGHLRVLPVKPGHSRFNSAWLTNSAIARSSSQIKLAFASRVGVAQGSEGAYSHSRARPLDSNDRPNRVREPPPPRRPYRIISFRPIRKRKARFLRT